MNYEQGFGDRSKYRSGSAPSDNEGRDDWVVFVLQRSKVAWDVFHGCPLVPLATADDDTLSANELVFGVPDVTCKQTQTPKLFD